MIIATTGAEGLRMEAVDLNESGQRIDLPVSTESSLLTVHALLFDADLDRLGWTSGMLERPRAQERTAPLQRPELASIYEAQPDLERSALNWAQLSALPSSLQEIQVVRSEPGCAEFAAPPFQATLPGNLLFVVPIDEQTALLGIFPLVYYLIDRNGTRLLQNEALENVSGAVRVGEDLWFTNLQGELFKGTPDPQEGVVDAELVATYAPGGSLFRMSGGETPNGVELIAAAAVTQRAVRFDGTAWTELSEFPLSQGKARVAWLAPGDAYFWIRGQTVAQHFDGTGTFPQSVSAGSGAFAIRGIPELGTVAGTGDGGFLVRDASDAWSQLSPNEFGWWSLDMTPLERGFAFLLASGGVGQYIPGFGFCPDNKVQPFINDGRILRLGRDLLTLGEDRDMVEVIYMPRAN